jgi:hypothetical protein
MGTENKFSGGYMLKFEISQELAQAILNYLAEQKYKETFQLIAELQKLKPINGDENNLQMELPKAKEVSNS